MTFDELIELVNESYPDDLVMRYYKEPHVNHGDTLAEFVVRELQDTFDKETSEGSQLEEAHNVMQKAADELTLVARHIGERRSG